jgi:O-acetyl-ADP-ribose deacetylase (regulator of RNase III)
VAAASTPRSTVAARRSWPGRPARRLRHRYAKRRDRRRAAGEVRSTRSALWQGGDAGEPELLASCHRRSLDVARKLDARTVAFPAISCGVYGYPIELAAAVAVRTVREHAHDIDLVRFVLFGDETYEAFTVAASG